MTVQMPTVEIKETTTKVWRVKSSVKVIVMTMCILSLSLFFEGCRQIKNGINFEHVATLVFGTIMTIFLLWVQAFWIYVEEKGKGSLKKRIVHFDRLQNYLEHKRAASE